MAITSLVLAFFTSLLASQVQATCYSYGVDFQNGGTYFQNASSTDPFTFVQYFEGCQSDEADNILVDPNADQYQCTQTPLTPDDTNQQSTCPIDKNQLYSGEWSIIIASNNGNGDPIAYERDFSLIVGVPTTITYTPTVSVTTTATPTSTKTATSTTVSASTVTKSVTSPAVTISPTTTVTPSTTTVTYTTTTSTVTKTSLSVEPLITTSTHTKTCSIPPSQQKPDTTAHISPTIIHIKASIVGRSEPTAAVFARDAVAFDVNSIKADRETFLLERRERLREAAAIYRRGLDQATTTVTDTNTADFKTSTATVTGTITSTVTTTVLATSVSTSTTTTTIYSGTTTLPKKTTTAPTPTSTKTTSVVGTTTSVLTVSPLVTIIISTAPAASSKACSSAGGKLV